MPSWQEHIILGSGMIKEVMGSKVLVSPVLSSGGIVAVPPVEASSGIRPSSIYVYPEGDVHFALNAGVSTIGIYSAILKSSQAYPFTLHPSIDTLYFVHPSSSTCNVNITWMAGR